MYIKSFSQRQKIIEKSKDFLYLKFLYTFFCVNLVVQQGLNPYPISLFEKKFSVSEKSAQMTAKLSKNQNFAIFVVFSDYSCEIIKKVGWLGFGIYTDRQKTKYVFYVFLKCFLLKWDEPTVEPQKDVLARTVWVKNILLVSGRLVLLF